MKYVFLFFFVLASWPASAENRIKIAVVDSGVDRTPALLPYICDEGHEDFTGQGLGDVLGHGTAIAELAVKGLDPSRFCVLSLKWLHWGGTSRSEERIAQAIRRAVKLRALYINLSLSGPGSYAEEQIAIQDALSRGATVIIAAGNEGQDLSKECDVYPACHPISHPRFHVVSNSLGQQSNYNGPVTDTAPGSAVIRGRMVYGTSFSAPRILNQLARQHVRH